MTGSLLWGSAARQLGLGGITLVAAAVGVSVDTISRGAGECDAGIVADGRVRAKGAGRRPVEATDPGGVGRVRPTGGTLSEDGWEDAYRDGVARDAKDAWAGCRRGRHGR